MAVSLRAPSAFYEGKVKFLERELLEAVRSAHLLEDSAIALAFNSKTEGPLPPSHAVSGTVFEQDRKKTVAALLTENAQRWLILGGDRWLLRTDRDCPGREILRWRAATALLPRSTWIGAAIAATGDPNVVDAGPSEVQAIPVTVAPTEEVNHAHIHLGPMLPFEQLWGSLWRVFLEWGSLDHRIPDIKRESLPRIGRVFQGARRSGVRWAWLLELAFVARTWLAQALRENIDPPPRELRRFALGEVDHAHRRSGLGRFWSDQRGVGRPWLRTAARMALDEARAAVRDGREPGERFPTDETRLIARAIQRITKSVVRPSDQAWVERLTYQYLRVKVALYAQLVVDPWVSGLQHFLDVDERAWSYRACVEESEGTSSGRRVRLQSATTEPPLRIGAIEVHIAARTWVEQHAPTRRPLDALRQLDCSGASRGKGDSRSDVRSAWVLSFVRDHDGFDTFPGRAWREKAKEAAVICRRIAARIEANPATLRAARGIGLMALERNGPVWLFAGPFRRLMSRARAVASCHSRVGVQPLRTAMHLGEDFHHILTGLRQILEPFEWGLIERGDRIGHAMALGLDPHEWQRRHKWVRMRAWDRFLDLGFVYWAFERFSIQFEDAHLLSRYRLEAGQCLDTILGTSPVRREAWKGQDPLGLARDTWEKLPVAAPEYQRVSSAKDAQEFSGAELIECVLDYKGVGQRAMADSISVDTAQDLPAALAIRRIVAKLVAEWQVAIEVNPSSNFLIGGLLAPFEQPIFHDHQLPITINADDPLTFATNLADEYAYAWAGMVHAAEVTPVEATRRLEDAARWSMRYAFSTERPKVEPTGGEPQRPAGRRLDAERKRAT